MLYRCLLSLALVLTGTNISFAAEGVQTAGARDIRIAFPTATLINGQIGAVLKNTDILGKNALKGDVQGFQYGPPMMEALVADKIDVAFTSEVPATMLLAKGHPAVIIASFGSVGRSAVMVPPESTITSIKDLKGKKVGVPFGSSPHRNLLQMLTEGGLDPEKDVEVLNIGKDELAAVLLKGGVDAIAAWDPGVEQFRRKNNFKIIAAKDFFSTVVMNRSFIDKNPEAVKAFMTSLKEAVLFMVKNKEKTNAWFAELSRLDPEVINTCAMANLNYKNVNTLADVNIAMGDDFMQMMRQSAEFTVKYMKMPQVDILKSVDTSWQK